LVSASVRAPYPFDMIPLHRAVPESCAYGTDFTPCKPGEKPSQGEYGVCCGLGGRFRGCLDCDLAQEMGASLLKDPPLAHRATRDLLFLHQPPARISEALEGHAPRGGDAGKEEVEDSVAGPVAGHQLRHAS